jgi:short-subunit dehydrogenase
MAQTVLITGATDGIGLALARIYVARGAQALLLGRRPAGELDPRLFTPERYLQVDLARPELAATVLRTALHERGIARIDRLIHNAALGAYGPPGSVAPDAIADLLAVNVTAPIALTHAALPAVLQAGGAVVFVSSVAAALPTPDYAIYTASKAALEGFARSLRVELGRRARVQVIRPGATRTQFHAKSGVPAGRLRAERFPAPDRVAAAIYRAIESGRREATIGWLNRVAWALGRFAA